MPISYQVGGMGQLVQIDRPLAFLSEPWSFEKKHIFQEEQKTLCAII